jgi:hypothetical protein
MIRIIQMMKRNGKPARLSFSLLGLLAFNLLADGLGQLLGYTFGLGFATTDLYPFEFHRTRHLVDQGVLEAICP